MRGSIAVITMLLSASPSLAWADGGGVTPDTWQRAWNFDPLVLLSLGVLAWLYFRGLARLWRSVGVSKKVRIWQAVAYFSGLGALFIALLSPLDALSEETSSCHMAQHMILTNVAAPLFILGAPTFVLAWGLPEWKRGRGSSLFRFALRLPQDSLLRQPLFVWILFAVVLWGWHHPRLYQAALRDPLLHDAQHLSFFIAACLFWRVCLDPISRFKLSPAKAIIYLFTTSLHASALGIFLTFSPQAWYDDYVTRVGAWGFTQLQDQQLAGLIMWLPSCLIYPTIGAILVGSWLSGAVDEERQNRRGKTALIDGNELAINGLGIEPLGTIVAMSK
jgi:putative membrane protein